MLKVFGNVYLLKILLINTHTHYFSPFMINISNDIF